MWLKKLIFLIFFVTVNCTVIQHVKDITVSSLANEIELWTKRNYETELFKEMIKYLKIPTELQNSDWRTFTKGADNAICTICQATVKTFIKLRKQGMSDESIKNKVIKLCVLMNIQKEKICKGVIELNLPTVMYIIDSKPNLTANTICGVVFETKSCPLKDPEFEWSINIGNSSKTVINEKKTNKEFKVLQITDIHYDPLYEPRGNSHCGEPVCCRKGQNKTNINALAGFWGDYESCDTPWHAIIDALTHIKQTHLGINYVYFTGDVIDHGVWETSKEGNIRSLEQIYNKIYEIFGKVPVFPVLGNHEPHPLNLFSPTNITLNNVSTNWLYESVADLWISYGWLPEYTRSTLLQGGYYTVTPKKGFRIIALNSNVCYCYNWWLWYTPRDPDNQLQWLTNTLLTAEKNQEFVHILSHVPVNSNSCLKTWKREYLKIINRFSHLIRAEFNGHTHNDEMTIFYNSNHEAENIAWNGGSITSYSKLNPNYKVYNVNGSSYAVTDYENWMYDLHSANKNVNKRPKWYKSYSFKMEYGLSDLSAKSLHNWIYTAINNETLLNKYYINFYKRAEASLERNCNLSCKKQYLCRTIMTHENLNQLCNNI
ncbi:sphingomyelin phosphodiesterase 1 [Nomia melanderi]|uniref:sphingomyelin phosphodiesterase 1 n=1 Tax=Nomia melanderi TaxID=2448451 RepID=UPI0013046834|nr:sphingomyelin phosphodiesterase 1-like [Nomia melanderi]